MMHRTALSLFAVAIGLPITPVVHAQADDQAVIAQAAGRAYHDSIASTLKGDVRFLPRPFETLKGWGSPRDAKAAAAIAQAMGITLSAADAPAACIGRTFCALPGTATVITLSTADISGDAAQITLSIWTPRPGTSSSTLSEWVTYGLTHDPQGWRVLKIVKRGKA
jgi:hypothetical protein